MTTALTTTPASGTQHAPDVIRGLRDAAAFLETRPGLPLARYSSDPLTIHVFTGGDDENFTEVDRIAGILGVTARLSRSGHYEAAREFGGGVAYRAIAIRHAAMDDYDAHTASCRALAARDAA